MLKTEIRVSEKLNYSKMKRNIKFKGIHYNGETFVTGNLVKGLDGSWYIERFNENQKSIIDYIVKEESIGQFTGLKDSKGIEIFEGDVVERSISGATPVTTDEVYFHKGMFVIGKGDFIKPIKDFHTLKVIGNVHVKELS